MQTKYICSLLALSLLTSLMSCEKFDHLMPDPPVQDISADQAELIRAFSGLTGGDPTACNVIYETETIPDVLCRIISDARPGSEIVFLVDKTSSMLDDIDEVKRNINQIIDCIPAGCRLGAAAYADNRVDFDWFNYIDLSDDYTLARQFINAISVDGGGDIPESVYDGIWEVLTNMSWKDCSAPDRIIVMGDAPPKTGSETDHSLEEVLEKARSICPDTEFYPVIILDI